MSLTHEQQLFKDKLVRKRGYIKGQLTSYKKQLDVQHANLEPAVLKVYNERLVDTFAELNRITEDLEELDPEGDHSAVRAAMEEDYCRLLGAGRGLLENRTSATLLPDANRESSQQRSSPNPFGLTATTTRLPEQTLPKFDGKYEEWLNFKEDFQSSIGLRSDLTGTQKLKYLRSCLRGEPERLVRSFDTTNASYQDAWNLLKETFEHKGKIVDRHLSAIFGIQEMQRESGAELSTLISTIQLHLSALKALNINERDCILIYIVLQKLDKTTRRDWKRAQRGNKVATLDELISFLRETVLSSDDTAPARPHKHDRSDEPKRGRGPGGDRHPRSQAHDKTQCFSTATPTDCSICKGAQHPVLRCQQFKAMPPKERQDIALKMRLCLNCLRPGHSARECGSKYTCMVCKQKHHTWLHYSETPKSTAPTTKISDTTTLVADVISRDLLVTAVVKVTDAHGSDKLHRTLLDTCSNANFMTDRLATSLGLPKERCSIPISAVNKTKSTSNYLVKATITSRLNQFTRTLSFLTVRDIAGLIPDKRIARERLNLPRNKPLADPHFDQPGEIDMLIGSGTTLSTLCVGQIKLSKPSEPDLYLQNTRLGWIIGGSILEGDSPKESINRRQCFLTNMERMMRRFWEIEEPVQQQHPCVTECEEHFRRHTRRDNSGQYIVALPFNEKKPELGQTRAIAEKRLASIERKLRRDPELQRQYTDVIEEYIALGHMTQTPCEPTTKGFYLPHHAVIKESSQTTKVRVVFDGSVKSTTGISLNEALLVGPTIQEDIFSLLLRFRKHNYVLTGDIEKMYRQFLVREEDRPYQRILWRNAENEIATYELNTITFGLSPAPYLAIRCLQQLAEDEGHEFPRAAAVIKNDLYVDDLLTGANTFEEALTLRDEINTLLQRGNLNLRQWASNDTDLLEGLPSSHINLKLQSKEDGTIKTLGVHWNSERDSIMYTVHPTPLSGHVTKRVILSDVARVFDPLGLLGPVITHAKLIMQRIWMEKLDWDDAVPLSIYTEWLNYTSQLSSLNNLSFPRRFTTGQTNDVQLHGFCDASERAYGACFYIRATDTHGGVTSTLLCAKGRVAPLKGMVPSTSKAGQGNSTNTDRVTIPRLELCAAQLLARLYTTVCQAMQLKPSKVILWSDSTITLHWIRTPPYRLQPFVANRVAEIQRHTVASDWRHVRSGDNPADLISRGQTPAEFTAPSIWKHGPNWLRKAEEDWPQLELASLERVPELRKVKCLATPSHDELITRYSSIIKLRRVIAYCRRFRSKGSGLLSTEELQAANNIIINLVQASCFPEELHELHEGKCINKKSKLKSLNPFLDGHGILRVGGRLRHASAEFNQKHPIILPRRHHVTELLTRYEHLRNYHSGVQATLYALRQKYWIINGRNQVRQIIRTCTRCHRVDPRISNCQMGDLPKVRVTEARPFFNVGIDYCGPFLIKEKKFRNRNRIKVYVAVFVCLAVKAVHLEVVSDMTSEGFIAALKRFIARRGLCRNIYSDNGTNFVGANNELKEIKQLLQSSEHQETLFKHLADHGINWHFMPPQSPNFGGIWEAAVKSFKRHMKRVVGDQLFTFEELNTFVIEVEAILNSRPLTPISADPNDLLVLTPGHFLIGNPLTSAPEQDLQKTPANRLSTWKHIQKVKQDFWKRWHAEYLTELNTRQKWTHGSHNIRPDTLVLIKDDNQPPLRWPMGRVIEVKPAADGIIRVVRVRTAKGIFTRNVRSLAPLPMDSGSEDNTSD